MMASGNKISSMDKGMNVCLMAHHIKVNILKVRNKAKVISFGQTVHSILETLQTITLKESVSIPGQTVANLKVNG